MNTSPLRVALVTGAGSGIGRAAAKALLGGGYCVVLTGRRLDALQNAIQLIGGNDSNCLAVTCDVGKPEDVKNLFSALKAKWGRIDL
jgi:NADP-dependent 3-hydroxy acid dehydrogenase YdfG